jgi:hypothetical protein
VQSSAGTLQLPRDVVKTRETSSFNTMAHILPKKWHHLEQRRDVEK